MRGKQLETITVSFPGRITPAHAGKTHSLLSQNFHTSDHPRACGENFPCQFFISLTGGSPPRMRGKRNISYAATLYGRITPAHAGKTEKSVAPYAKSADHPRACGENRLHALSLYCVIGSPPRMRGKRYTDSRIKGVGRITPAHAGKTRPLRHRQAHTSDHPRACGENRVECVKRPKIDGSPPRMRGKRGLVMRRTRALRITPAHAGKTHI